VRSSSPPSPSPPRTSQPARPSGRAERGAGPDRHAVSPLTVNRLSIYLRSLRTLADAGIARISSQELARRFHLSSTQIRKDLAQFGEFGVRGVGYDVRALAGKLADLLGLDRCHPLLLVGLGNLGTALARSPAFNSGEFRIIAGFDSDPAKLGRRIGNVTVRPIADLPDVALATGAKIAILAVPADAALRSLEALVAVGVTSVLNFAPVSLPATRGCRVRNADLRIHLEELAFFLRAEEA
jgi:redox-sensing transcriptional repressor